MFGNEKIKPYYMYNIKSWIFSYKVVLNAQMCKPVLYIYFSIVLSPASCIYTSCLIAICHLYVHFVHACSK